MDETLTKSQGDGAAEDFDLRDLLVSGRNLSLADRLAALSSYTGGAGADKRCVYGREVLSAADREVSVWDEQARAPRRMLMFGSNNYLGLATHPHVRAEVRRSIRHWGVGVGGPPLLNGYTRLHRQLEERLATREETEAALVFSSGFGANAGLVAALAQPGDLVVYDAGSHASFYDGLRLSGARAHRFHHNDVDHLADLLAAAEDCGQAFVGVEGVYSMSGDLAPLDRLVPLCRDHGALLILDDAHGSGVMGARGYGTAEHFGVAGEVDIVMGTFSKTFAVTGGFVAASKAVVEYLRFFARPYMFSASPPPMVVAAVLAGMDVLESEPERVMRLRENVAYAAGRLNDIGFALHPQSAIISLTVPAQIDIYRAAALFQRRGLFVNTTAYPAVPKHAQQFRLSIMATHRREDIDRLVDCVEEVWSSGGAIPDRPARRALAPNREPLPPARMDGFLRTVNYSSCNEDGRSECTALRLTPGDRVLCITGSGARVLDLLTRQPDKIVAVDLNPCQNHLLELKMAAIRHLDYDTFLAFLGVTPLWCRLGTYAILRDHLSPPARRFWDAHRRLIRRGVIYAGRWERHFRALASIIAATRPARLQRLFACDNVADQALLWEREWQDLPWHLFLRAATAGPAWQLLLRDPAFYRHVPRDFGVYGYIEGCLSRAAGRVLFRDSAFATLLFRGQYVPGGPLPLHLQRESFPLLRDALGGVEIVTGSLLRCIRGASTRYSAYSLSDVGSYMSEGEYGRLWQAVLESAQPGARVCERQFLVKRLLPPEASQHVRQDSEMERILERSDDSLFYTFVVAHIVRGGCV